MSTIIKFIHKIVKYYKLSLEQCFDFYFNIEYVRREVFKTNINIDIFFFRTCAIVSELIFNFHQFQNLYLSINIFTDIYICIIYIYAA